MAFCMNKCTLTLRKAVKSEVRDNYLHVHQLVFLSFSPLQGRYIFNNLSLPSSKYPLKEGYIISITHNVNLSLCSTSSRCVGI